MITTFFILLAVLGFILGKATSFWVQAIGDILWCIALVLGFVLSFMLAWRILHFVWITLP